MRTKETLDRPERLKLSITPLDILYLYSNDEIKTIRNDMNLPRRGNPRSQIDEALLAQMIRLIENYHLLAYK
ncbi:hypothetical protein O9992_15265 [Vibrio lentus]|nr:hypothetical protein [Vibrio lentus]